MNQSHLWTVAAWVLVSGCAAAPPQPAAAPAEPAATITFRTKTLRSFEHATVTDQYILGPNIDVTRSGDAYRGRAHGEIVDLQWDGDTLAGKIGNGTPTSLRYREYPDGFVLEGVFSGARGLFALRSRRMTGVVGARRFDLVTDDGMAYREQTISLQPMEVVLSPSLVGLPRRQQAAFLALFLRR